MGHPVAKREPPSKLGGDGLRDRERAFVKLTREQPELTAAARMKLAGYQGDRGALTERARVLLRKPLVMAAITAPARGDEKEITDEDLKREVRRRLRAIMNDERTSDADKIKACDKLLATIVGGYVPVQFKAEGKFTLESWVAAMGGAPVSEDRQPQLQERPE